MQTNSILAMLLILPAALSANNKTQNKTHETSLSFTITGNIKDLLSEKMYLEYHTTGKDGYSVTHLDSVLVHNGHFVFEGQVQDPAYTDLRSDDEAFFWRFWLENSNINVTGTKGKYCKVFNSKTEDEFQLFNKVTHVDSLRSKVQAVKYELMKAREENTNASQIEELDKEYKRLVGEWNNNAEQFVILHPDSYVSLNHIWNRSALDKLTYNELSKYLGYLTPSVRESTNGQILQEHLAKLKKLTLGEQAPEYSQLSLSGDTVRIADYKGKYLLLTFGDAGINDYRNENVNKVRLYDIFHKKGFEIADVLFNRKREQIEKMAVEDKITWKLLCDFKGWSTAAVKDLVIESIPQNILVDPNGIIIAQNIYGKELESKLNEVIK